MKLLFDFFPLALFLIVYKFSDIYMATMVIIVASVVQVGVHWLIHRRFEKMHLVSLALFIVLGGMTLYLRDKRFIMWKPTIVNWLFAAAFLVTGFIGQKKSLIERMLGGQMSLPSFAWQRLNMAWILFFIVSGLINLFFAQQYISAQDALVSAVPTVNSDQLANLDCAKEFATEHQALCQEAADREKTWVTVKVFGLMALTILFIIGQSIYLMRHLKDTDQENPDTPNQSTDL